MTDARKLILEEVMAFADPARMDVGNWDICTDNILSALKEAGYVVVPLEPSSAQAAKIHAAVTEVFSTSRSVWRAMVEAAHGE
jgi:hypothetical protein